MNERINSYYKNCPKKLTELSLKHKNKNIFFSVKGGGCNSFTYHTKMDKNSLNII